MPATQDHIQALSKAKIQLMARPDSAFFTTVCFSLKHVWDDRVSTAATNGKSILFNPKFFMSLDVEEQIFLLLHESMHVAYLHMVRRGDRDPRKFNIAADYVINLQLVERGFKMPSMGLLDHQYAGMSTEQVYDALPEDPPQQCDQDLIEGEGEPGQMEADIQDILVRAQIQSKMANDKAGTIPGEIQIALDRLLEPKLPWNRILQKYLQSFARSDYSFKKPSRRFFPKYHMPSLWGQNLMDLAIAVDVSGSVSDFEFNRIVTETASILKMMKPDNITVVQFDTEIKSVDKVSNLNQLMNVKFTGRGGTLISPVLQWANENKPQALLVFSDGGFRFYDYPCNVDTLWLIHDNEKWDAPFGKVVHYTSAE